LAETVEFYYYANCSSCRKADALLRLENIPAKRREFFKQRFSATELRALLARAGLSVQEALSTRSRPYQELGLANKTLPDDALLALMAEHPALLRRPLLVWSGGALVGFNQAAYEALGSTLNGSGKDG
jgi:regulatory protein spx